MTENEKLNVASGAHAAVHGVHRAGHHCTVRTGDIGAEFGKLIRALFVEHCFWHSEENKPVLLALAQARIDHPERTLNAVEIDAVIAETIARQGPATEHVRRAAWRQVTERVARSPRSTMTTWIHSSEGAATYRSWPALRNEAKTDMGYLGMHGAVWPNSDRYPFPELAPSTNLPDIGRGNWRMTRREFVSLAGGTAVAWPRMAQAQQLTVPIPRIAYLGASSPAILDPRQIEQFKVGLTENGLIEGQNIRVDYLWGEGSPDRLRQHAADLAKRNLSVVVTAGPQPVRALLEAKVTSPIVFAILSDPISDGFVQSLARPGGNLTGLSMVGTDLESKRLQILKDGVPAVAKVMLLHDPTMGSTVGLEEAKSSARGLGLEILVGEVADVDKLADIFIEALRQNVNGVAGLASPLFNFNRKRLVDLCSQYRLPSIWEAIAYIRDGGLISYGPSFPDMYRRSAGYVAKILKGTKPSELPVQQPTRFELALNLKTAKTLGVTLPVSLIGQADEVVE